MDTVSEELQECGPISCLRDVTKSRYNWTLKVNVILLSVDGKSQCLDHTLREPALQRRGQVGLSLLLGWKACRIWKASKSPDSVRRQPL